MVPSIPVSQVARLIRITTVILVIPSIRRSDYCCVQPALAPAQTAHAVARQPGCLGRNNNKNCRTRIREWRL